MVANIDQHLGERLALARKQCGLSVEDIANRIDLPVDRLTGFELGTVRIPALCIARLARALDVTPGWLFAGLPGQGTFDQTG